MNTYEYECQQEDCQFSFEVRQSIKDKHRYKKCPACERFSLERVIFPSDFFIKDVKTLGQLAEQNNKKLGTYGLQAKERKLQEQQEQNRQARLDSIKKKLPPGAKIVDRKGEHKPWYGKAPDSVQQKVKSGDQKGLHKYIMEGK